MTYKKDDDILFNNKDVLEQTMSHILIFTGGLHPPKEALNWLIGEKGKPDFIIAADSGLHFAERFGFTPDLIVGDMDSLSTHEALDRYKKEQIMFFPTDKNETDTEIALQEAWKRGANCISLCGGDGGRLDHLLGILKLFEGDIHPDVWLCKEQAVFSLKPLKDTTPFDLTLLDVTRQNNISIFPIRPERYKCKIESQGLEWPLQKVDWNSDRYSLSNRINDEHIKNGLAVKIRAISGQFIAIVPYM